MFLCSIKLFGLVSLFPKIDFQNFHVPCSAKLVSFPCSLKIFANVPLFPKIDGHVSLFTKTPGKASVTNYKTNTHTHTHTHTHTPHTHTHDGQFEMKMNIENIDIESIDKQ